MALRDKIELIDNTLVLPHTSENSSLQKDEEDKWGNILNEKTFKTLNNNTKKIKEILFDMETEVSNIKSKNDDLDTEILKIKGEYDDLKPLKNEVSSLKTELQTTNSSISSNTNRITTLEGRDYSKYANVLNNNTFENSNTFKGELNVGTTDTFSIKNNNKSVFSRTNNNIQIGNSENTIEFLFKEGTLLKGNDKPLYEYVQPVFKVVKSSPSQLSNEANEKFYALTVFTYGHLVIITGYFKGEIQPQWNTPETTMFTLPPELYPSNPFHFEGGFLLEAGGRLKTGGAITQTPIKPYQHVFWLYHRHKAD